MKLFLRLAWILPAAALMLVGCGGGGGSGGGSKRPSNAPNDKEQVIIAAYSVQHLSTEAQAMAEMGRGMAEGMADDASGTLSNGQSFLMSTTSSSPEPCDTGGTLTIVEDPTVELADIEDLLPSPFDTNSASPPGEGVTIQANQCSLAGMVMNGQTDAIEFDVGGSEDEFVYTRFGGIDRESDFADVSKPFLVTAGNKTLQRFQGELAICIGRVDSNLDDFSNDPRHGTMVGQMILEMDMAGMFGDFDFGDMGDGGGDWGDFQDLLDDALSGPFGKMRLELGDMKKNQPLVVTTAPGGSINELYLEADGRQAYEDAQCAMDVSFKTHEPVYITNWQDDEGNITSGKMDITVNQSGKTYEVEWRSGELYIDGTQQALDVYANLTHPCVD